MILPVAARELIVAARRNSTFRARFLAVLAGVILLWWQVERTWNYASFTRGPAVFSWLAFWLWLFSLTVGVWLTSDCISEERREGTLGLLFLTKLKGRDITLGKLVGRSVTAFYSIIGILPILAVPYLMGGIYFEQIRDAAIAIVLTMICSIAGGVFISSLNRIERKAIFFTVVLLLISALGPFLLAFFLNETLDVIENEEIWRVLFPSPGFVIGMSLGLWNALWPAWTFWLGCASVLASTLVFLFLANRFVVRKWGDLGQMELSGAKRHHSLKPRVPNRQLLDRNPFLWLAYREKSKSRNVWIFTGSVLFFWLLGVVAYGRQVLEPQLAGMFALVVNGILKLWIIRETCSRVAADKKSGAFELLLATPLQPPEIIKGLALSLAQQFWKPVLFLTLVESIPLVVFYGKAPGHTWFDRDFQYHYLMLCAAVILLVLDSIAIFFLGLWSALWSRSYTAAVMLAALAVLLLPRAIHWVDQATSGSGDHAVFFLGTSLILDFIFIAWAARKLRRGFRFCLTEMQR